MKISRSTPTTLAFLFMTYFRHGYTHRRRIKTEEKAKVVASVWGEEFIKFPAALAIMTRTILKNRMKSSISLNHPVQFILYFKSSSAKQLARQGIEYILPHKQKRRPLPFLQSLFFFYACTHGGNMS